MSLAVDSSVSVVPIRDAVTAVNKKVHYGAGLSGTYVSHKNFPASAWSNSSFSWSCDPPSPSTIVDRHIYVTYEIDVALTCVAVPGVRPFQSGYTALRALPLHSVMDTLACNYNNNTITSRPSEFVHEMQLLRSSEKDQLFDSTAPSYQDQSQEYSQLANTNRNCLASYGEKNDGISFRGAHPIVSITGNAAGGTSATIRYKVTEVLQQSPLLAGAAEGKGFLHLQSFGVRMNFDDLSRMISHDVSGPIGAFTNVAITFASAPVLKFTYYTASPTQALPEVISYDYQTQEIFRTAGNTEATDAAFRITSNNVQLNTCPSYLMCYIRKSQSAKVYTDTDSWCEITGASITFGNQSSILANASEEELYEISRSNGIELAWNQWTGQDIPSVSGGTQVFQRGQCSPLLLKMGSDVTTGDLSVAPGVPGSFNLQVQIDAVQRHAAATQVELIVMPIFHGILTMSLNQVVLQQAVLSQQDVLDAEMASRSGSLDTSHMEGAGWFDDVSKGFEKALPIVRKIRSVAQKVASHPAVQMLVPEAQLVSQGLQVAQDVGLGRQGGFLMGGQRMSKAQMAARLRR